MTWQIMLVFGLLAGTFTLMVWEELSIGLVAMLAFAFYKVLVTLGLAQPL